MFSNVLSAVIRGVECHGVNVEADVGDGLPMFTMVGYLSSQVKEAQERVKTALKNSGIHIQPKKITINLSPADLRKDGTAFDLPIAIAVLAAYGYLVAADLKATMIIGELGLNGQVKGISGVLPMVRYAAKHGCKRCIVPFENAKEGGLVKGITVIGVKYVNEVLKLLQGDIYIEETETRIESARLKGEFHQVEDFKNIRGQAVVKRAAEVAAAGMHNMLMIGAPGSAKSMVAKAMAGILPELSVEEMLEISEIYSVAGLLNGKVPMMKRPFRSPHHTITAPALIGGGHFPRPGEISLAHRGVLFLDELPEFKRSVLDMLRQPMEEKQVRVNRRNHDYEFPANCMIIAAMNPCKCGYYPDAERCSCTEMQVQGYLHKISGPLLDRMDISVEASRVEYRQLASDKAAETSACIRKRVTTARAAQQRRYKGTEFAFNSDLDAEGIKKYCCLGEKEHELMEKVFEKMWLSARGYHRIIKVARTIADLEKKERIQCEHIAEAICYRTVEQKYWK